MVAVTVADRGLGISTGDAHRIFDKYVRLADSEDHQTIEGSGLGLYLVKAMVAAEGGEIDVETNTNGVGSVFTYTLPAAP
jgi:signal transduction histidine kinase